VERVIKGYLEKVLNQKSVFHASFDFSSRARRNIIINHEERKKTREIATDVKVIDKSPPPAPAKAWAILSPCWTAGTKASSCADGLGWRIDMSNG
jgi:hypothetical protein